MALGVAVGLGMALWALWRVPMLLSPVLENAEKVAEIEATTRGQLVTALLG